MPVIIGNEIKVIVAQGTNLKKVFMSTGEQVFPPVYTNPNSMEWDIPGEYDWVVPAGLTTLKLCMIGGGGSGDSGGAHTGGTAGQIKAVQDVTVNPGDTLHITVGAGGPGVYDKKGKPGEESIFDPIATPEIVAAGSPGAGYKGDSEETTNCYGTFSDGASHEVVIFTYYGGQAGFSNGETSHSNDATKGSGSGPGGKNKTKRGGDGVVRISWLD